MPQFLIMKNTKNILILGHSGFIGANLFRTFSNYYEITTWSREDGPIELIDLNNCDYVINCVGYYGNSRESLIDSNINFIRKIIDHRKNNSQKKSTLIHLGSLGIINDHRQINSSLIDPHQQKYSPINDYEKSKAIGNLMLKTSERIDNQNVVIINPAMVLGSKSEHWTNILEKIYSKYNFLVFPSMPKTYISFCKIDYLIQFIKDIIDLDITDGEYFIGENCQINLFLETNLKLENIWSINKNLFLISLFMGMPIYNLIKGRAIFDNTLKRNLTNSKTFRFDRGVKISGLN